MKKIGTLLSAFLVALMFSVANFAQSSSATYVGPKTCLTCHPDKASWANTLHANGYSFVPNDSNSLVVEKGVVADYDQNGTDDFKDGLDFNKISSKFDQYKPNAPVLSYDATNGYMIQVGDLKMKVFITYGGSGFWKQRYMVKIMFKDGTTKNSYVSPVQYNEKTHEWVPYHPQNWYDANNKPLYNANTTIKEFLDMKKNKNLAGGCAGCHVTGLTVTKDADGEWIAHGATPMNPDQYKGDPSYFDLDGDGQIELANTTCERCHGPGSEHVLGGGDTSKIINPEKDLTVDQANNICGMCHSRGHSKPNGTFGFPYDDTPGAMHSWKPGDMVTDYYTFAPGNWGDDFTPEDHHQQFIDLYNSKKEHNPYEQVACYDCHDPHGSKNEHMIVESVDEEDANGNPITIPTDADNNTLCLSCHSTHGDFADISKEMVKNYDANKDSIGAVVSRHTHHPYFPERKDDPDGKNRIASRCISCHMPKTATSAVHYDVHTHNFQVIPPEKTKKYNMPNSCAVSCHAKADYPHFGVNITDADFTDWSGTAQQTLADSLMEYFGPNGKWWKVSSVHMVDLKTPKNFSLSQNYPNPFNPTTRINFSIPQQTHVRLVVYDALGNQVDVLFNGVKPAGNYFAEWNASKYASGVYIYRLEAGNFVQVKKMMLLK